jgi:hypothetical protein
MTPILSYCTARPFKRGFLPLVEMKAGLSPARADNDRIPCARDLYLNNPNRSATLSSTYSPRRISTIRAPGECAEY